jgi:septal ring factor EnvC (AmiA/AmiB activator)
MKIGTFLFIFLIVLLSWGVLFNENIDTHSDLKTANSSLSSCQVKVDQNNEQIAQLATENQVLLTKNNSFQAQLSDLQGRYSNSETQVETLIAEVNRLQRENSRLQQLATTTKLNTPLNQGITNLFSQKATSPQQFLAIGIFVPILLAGSIAVVSNRSKHIHKFDKNEGYVVRVSRHELDLLICHRRTK